MDNHTLKSGGRTTWRWVGYEPFVPSYDDMFSGSRSDHFTVCKVPSGRLTPYKELESGGSSGGDVDKIYTNCPSLSVISFEKSQSRARNMRWIRRKASTAETIFFFLSNCIKCRKEKIWLENKHKMWTCEWGLILNGHEITTTRPYSSSDKYLCSTATEMIQPNSKIRWLIFSCGLPGYDTVYFQMIIRLEELTSSFLGYITHDVTSNKFRT